MAYIAVQWTLVDPGQGGQLVPWPHPKMFHIGYLHLGNYNFFWTKLTLQLFTFLVPNCIWGHFASPLTPLPHHCMQHLSPFLAKLSDPPVVDGHKYRNIENSSKDCCLVKLKLQTTQRRRNLITNVFFLLARLVWAYTFIFQSLCRDFMSSHSYGPIKVLTFKL